MVSKRNLATITATENAPEKGRYTFEKISWGLVLIYLTGLIPLLIIAWYNYPSADDFSMANEVRIRFVESGSVLATIQEAVRMAKYYYANWCGYYFSDFLMAMPPCVFGERYYVLSTYFLVGILSVGTVVFMHALLVKTLHVNKAITRCITMLILLITVQCMPRGSVRVEAFYWYAGAVNYVFMYGIGLLYLSVFLYYIQEKNKKRQKGLLLVATLLGFAMGGANYMSALSCAIISTLLVIFIICSVINKITWKIGEREIDRNQYLQLLIPLLIMLTGFILSCTAPGNAVRSAHLESMNPIKTVMVALFYTLEYAVGKWTNWSVLCLILFVLPFLWKAAKQISWDFRYPFLAIAFFYGMTAANIAPPLYAERNIEGGRIQALLWIQYVLCLILCLLYLCGWVQRNGFINSEKSEADVRMNGAVKQYMSTGLCKYLITIVLLIMFGSCLFVAEDSHFYTATSAATDLINGKANQFRKEWAERYVLLNDSSVKEVVVKELSVRPELLYYSDISQDPDDWSNKGMREYFDKEVVYSTSNYTPEE